MRLGVNQKIERGISVGISLLKTKRTFFVLRQRIMTDF